MVKVFVHTRPTPQHEWQSEGRDLTRLPCVGEYVAMGLGESDWHRVTLVVHAAYHAEYEGEIFTEAVDHVGAVRRATTG